MPMVTVRVELREQADGNEVPGGTLILDENNELPWSIPCCASLLPGNHRFQASHPNRTILPPNPRDVNVVVSTDPQAQEQPVYFEVAPTAPASPI